MKKDLKGLHLKYRNLLSKLLLLKGGIISVESAAETLDVPRRKATYILFRLAKSGWLHRVKRGLYIPIPLEAQTRDRILEEPWVIANSIFAPCYIGGWSAVSHWDLTDQVFNSTFVYTSKKSKKRKQLINDHLFVVQKVSSINFIGLKSIWVSDVKLKISDPSKTIVDLLENPANYGGIKPVYEVFCEYLRSEHKSLNNLISYAEEIGNKTVFKRLGFLLEIAAPKERTFIEKCLANLSEGYSKLDPSLSSDRLIKKWKLWVSDNWKGQFYDTKG